MCSSIEKTSPQTVTDPISGVISEIFTGSFFIIPPKIDAAVGKIMLGYKFLSFLTDIEISKLLFFGVSFKLDS